jgi:hypothetical protein
VGGGERPGKVQVSVEKRRKDGDGISPQKALYRLDIEEIQPKECSTAQRGENLYYTFL